MANQLPEQLPNRLANAEHNEHSMVENITLDIHYVWSRFISQPSTFLVIILTLALSIGATTAIFSVVNGLMFQATPFKDSEQLVILQQQDLNSDQRYGFSASELLDYQSQAQTFDNIAEYHNMTFTMYGHDDPVRVRTGIVSANFFGMLNLKPILGRTFTDSEDDIGAEPLVLLTYEFWQKEFNSDKDVLNQSVEFNNRSHKIIGVLPHFPQFPNVNDVYMAIPSCPWRSSENALANRQMRMMSSFAKIKSSSSLEQVNNEIANIAEKFAETYPEAYTEGTQISAQALSLHEELVRDSKPYLYTLLATTLLLFLIATANVTNLTLSQHAKRKREFAVRSSLGASKARITQLLLTESILLSLFGGGLGLLLAYLGLDFLKDFASNFSPLATEITIDINVMLFALTIAILAGLISGLAPTFGKIDLVNALKEGGKSSYSTEKGLLRNTLLIAQFSLSLTLLIAAGLTIKSLNNLQNIDAGYDAKNINIAQLDLNWSIYQNGDQQWQISQQILQEVRKLPYLSSAALSMTYANDVVALNFGQVRQAIRFDDRDYQADNILPNTYNRPITEGYFSTISSQIIQGRDFTANDDNNARQVTIINQAMAKSIWPNESAIEHQLSFDNGQNWLTIVGVVENIFERGATQESGFQIYRPMAQSPTSHITILAKSSNSSTKISASQQVDLLFERDIKKVIAQLDNRQPISKFESLQEALDNSISSQRFLAELLSIFSLIALIITISGVTGVMTYLVNMRRREIGIRMAIGADKFKIMMMILSYGSKLTFIGLAVGLFASYYSGDWLSSQLFEINAFDLTIYTLALVILLTISTLACSLPAWRASTTPPIQALKSQ